MQDKKRKEKKQMSQMGRPKSENPKSTKFSLRLDTQTEATLENYCMKHNISKGEAVRKGIDLLVSEERNENMNGFNLVAESYKRMVNDGKIEKEVAEKEIRIYEFLSTCDDDDFCSLIDSSAFNGIIRAYLTLAINNADIDEKAKDKVVNQLNWIFDERTAKQVLKGN